MAGTIYEWYGYRALDNSPEAKHARASATCPFTEAICVKRTKGGVCSVTQGARPVIICPHRLYFSGHAFLKHIAVDAFGSYDVLLGDDGLPMLARGRTVHDLAKASGRNHVGVYGRGWEKEIRLPPSTEGGASYSVDFTLTVVSPEGELLGFAPVEVQTIDTTGNYKTSLNALVEGTGPAQSTVGMNWENVSKRILPQLIVKGLMLQGERLCTHGIYFVTPEPVYERIAKRLGGMDRLREIPRQPASITFVRYAFDTSQSAVDGRPLSLQIHEMTSISTSDMSIAFISPQNLPPAGAYEAKLLHELGL